MQYLLASFLVLYGLSQVAVANQEQSTVPSWTDEEQAFLAAHPVINVSNEMDWPPFDFADNSEPQGYSIDILRRVAEILGVQFNYINGYEWAELYKKFERREIDVIHPLYKTPAREKAGLFTTTLYAGRHHFITRKSEEDVGSPDQLKGKTVAVVKGYATVEFLKDRYPEVNLYYTSSLEESLNAVSSGVAFATIEIKDVAQYAFKTQGRADLRVNTWFRDLDYTRDSNLYYAVRKDWPVLRDLLNKALDRISVTEYEALRVKWFGSDLTTRVSLTPKEEAWLASNKEIVVGNEADYPPFNFSIGDNPQGYSTDVLNLVADRLGLRLRHTKPTTFNHLLGEFKEGRVDLLHSAAKTPEREKFALYSNSYVTFRTRFATRSDVPDIKGFDDLKGKTVAAGKGWFQEEFIRTNYPEIKLLLVNTAEEMLDAVASEQAYATVINEKTMAYLFTRVGYTGLKVSGWARELDGGRIQKYYFLTQPSSPILNDLINKALRSLSNRDLEDARQKWFGGLEAGMQMVAISESEADYLNRKGVVTYCADPSWYPFEFIDDEGIQGLTKDYIELITESTDMTMALKRTKSWVETIEALKNRECDMAMQIAETESRLEYLIFTQPYLFFPQVVVTRTDTPFISGTSGVLGEKIAAVEGYAIVEILSKKYPDLDIVEVKNHEEGVLKVAEGEVFGFIDFLPSASRAVSDFGAGTLKIAGSLDEKISLGAGVRSDAPELRSVMSKAIQSVSARQHRNIMDKWMTIKYEQGIDYDLMWKILAAIGALALLFAYRHRQISLYNKQMHKVNGQLEQTIVALRQTQQKLIESEKMGALGKVLQGVAHELNTPLGVCMTACSVLKDDSAKVVADSESGELTRSGLKHYFASEVEALKLIDSNLRRAADLVAVFKQLSPEEYGDELDEINLQGLLNFTLSRFSQALHEKHIQVQCTVADDASIITHPSALEAVLHQLVSNVVDHAFSMPNASPKLTIEVSLGEQEAALVISDNGDGIDSELIERIFQPFYTTARIRGKTGLGLSIVYNLVTHRLNGNIRYYENSGGGTCCELTLPLQLQQNRTNS